VAVIVYVIVSPIGAIVLSTAFVNATLAVKISVLTILLVVVRVIVGALGAVEIRIQMMLRYLQLVG